MPGSGKSTLGVLFAKAEMYAFCDTDLLIFFCQVQGIVHSNVGLAAAVVTCK